MKDQNRWNAARYGCVKGLGRPLVPERELTMTIGKLHLLVFALMLCVACAIAPREASAHAGHAGPHPIPHSDLDLHRDVQKQNPVMVARDHGAAGGLTCRCGAHPCCGIACYSGGHAIAGAMMFRDPAESSALIQAPSGMLAPGRGSEGIRRPPRV